MQIRYFVISLAAALLGFSGSLNATGITGSSGGTTQNSGSTQSDDSDSGSCSNAGYNALMNFNYDSGFPLRIMGNTTVAGSDVPHPPRRNQPVYLQMRTGTLCGVRLHTRYVAANPFC